MLKLLHPLIFPFTGNRILSLAVFVSVALLIFGSTGCQTTGPAAQVPPSPDVLRVGVTANMPPFSFERDGEIVGMEIDFARALAEELGREPRFIRMDWEDLIPALQENRVDILMAGMNYTPERAAIIRMSNPYLRSGQKALVLRKNAADYPMAGLIARTSGKVGAEAGSTGEYLVESRFRNATLKTYKSADQGARAVANGDIEFFIHDAPTIFWMAGLYQNRGVTVAAPVFTEDLMVWGISRGSSGLLDAVNETLNVWSQDGTLNRIIRRWIDY